MGLTNPRVCKLQRSSNPMFGVKRLSLDRERNHGVAFEAQHQVGSYCLRGKSGSIPRSIFASRSWCRKISTTIVITPPTRNAVIGIRNGPKLTIDSMIRIPELYTNLRLAADNRIWWS